MRVNAEGPIPAKLLICGEAPGETEDQWGRPFWGASGYRLVDWLAFASKITGIEILREDCWITNLVMDRPDENKIANFCVSKREAVALLPGYAYPPLAPGKYLHPDKLFEYDRLIEEVNFVNPTVILALGNAACWAFLQKTGIKKLRGTVASSVVGDRVRKVLPTYHPAYTFRSPRDETIAIQDVIKAFSETQFPEIRRPRREVWIEPTLEDLYEFQRRYIPLSTEVLAVDVETKRGLITCIGFAPDPHHALVIPFTDDRKPGGLYWTDRDEFRKAILFVQALLRSPIDKVLQNGLYDFQYCWRVLRTPILNFSDDTMLIQHALWPEMEKSLGFLGSIYTNEASWKMMRTRGKAANLKREE